MTDDSRKIVRIFLASPGGLEKERELASRIVGEINSSHAEKWGCALELIGWEQTLPGYDRAQSVINRDLDKCQYFVGLMSDHWGSPPEDSEGNYSSGFEEEFERAKGHNETGVMKDIALYFKEIPTARLRDPGDSLKKVIEFKESITKARKPLFQEFQSADGFGIQIRRYLESIGWKESPLNHLIESQSARSIQPEEEYEEQDVPASQNGFIEPSASEFLNELLARPPEWDATSSTEVARLRLLGVANNRNGNDEVVLGNHDANLLFIARNEMEFSGKELRALIETGVAGYGQQNVPLWYWLKEYESPEDSLSRLDILSWVSDGEVKKNAIRLLQLLQAPVPSVGGFDRTKMLTSWVLDEDNPDACLAGIDYLRTDGLAEDAEFIVENLSSFLDQQKEKAIEAALFILARKSRSDALEVAVKLDPNSISESAADTLFDEPSALTTNQLKKCTSLKADFLRKHSVSILIERHALDVETLRKFISDSDFSIRRIAIQRLVKIGEELSENSIRQTLIKRPRNQSAFSGLFANSNRADDSEYELYKKNQLVHMEHDELLARYKSSSVFDELEAEVLFNRFGKRYKNELLKNIKDGFASHFESKLQEFAQKVGHDDVQIEKTRGISGFIRQKLTTAALDSLCKINSKSDISIVRKAIRENELFFSKTVLAYLGKHGNWNDKEVILSYSDKYAAGKATLRLWSEPRYPDIASALYSIGRGRLVDLLKLELHEEILAEIFNCLTQKNIRSLDRPFLVELLNRKNDRARVNLAKKCVVHLTKPDLKLLLDGYCKEGESRFYNVVHWLDLGTTMPRSTARKVVNSCR
ncbi:MAG: DUF4062 domain-containing protein [Pseudomonadota bacterium]